MFLHQFCLVAYSLFLLLFPSPTSILILHFNVTCVIIVLFNCYCVTCSFVAFQTFSVYRSFVRSMHVLCSLCVHVFVARSSTIKYGILLHQNGNGRNVRKSLFYNVVILLLFNSTVYRFQFFTRKSHMHTYTHTF